MAEIKNRDNERKRCREFYQKWDFIRRIVDLYAEGVSWKGCKVITPAEPDKIPVQYSHIIDVDSIKNGVRGMLVDGTGDFNLKVLESELVLPILMPKEAPIAEEPPGRPFLLRATTNADALDAMVNALGTSPDATHMAEMIENDMCAVLGVPRQLLLPNAATADPTAIMGGLIIFRGEVEELRKHLAFHMAEAVRPLISEALSYTGPIEVEWNEDWYQSGFLCGYGPIYQVFKAQGIELSTLAEQILNAAKSGLDSSLISRQVYEESVKWFLEG